MIDKIKEHIAEVEAFSTQSKEEIESFRIKYLSKKGLLNEYFAAFKSIPNEQKKEFGQVINALKKAAEEKVLTLKSTPIVALCSGSNVSSVNLSSRLKNKLVEDRNFQQNIFNL